MKNSLRLSLSNEAHFLLNSEAGAREKTAFEQA
jgi:hypothetical protein